MTLFSSCGNWHWISLLENIALWSTSYIPANFFWDISVRFLSWECWDFWRRHDRFRRFPKKSEVFRRRPKSAEVCQRRACFQCFSLQKSEITRKVLPFIDFTHGFRSLHGSELTYFWKSCQAGRQQLTFFNQAWEIGAQAWAGVRSKFSTGRCESWQVYSYVFMLWPKQNSTLPEFTEKSYPGVVPYLFYD